MFTKVFKFIRTNPELGVSLRRKTLGFSHLEAGLYALMVGCSETFALYYAVKRGVSKPDLALLSTVPIVLGALANWIIPQFIKAYFIKPALLALVFTQMLGLLGLFYSVNVQNYFTWILTSLSLYWIGGLAAGPIWIDWMSGWLPHERLGRYLSRRNGFTALFTVIAYLLAAVWIHHNESFFAYQIIFGIALLCRFFSFVILSFQPHPVGIEMNRVEPFEFSKAFKSKPIWIVIVFAAAFRLSANVASPFFLPYMVDELKFSLIDYAWITAVPFLARSIFSAQWGEAVKSHRPFIGLQIAMLILSMVCLLWTFTNHLGLLSIVEGFSGFAWGGFELSGVMILYGFAPRKARAIVGFYSGILNIAALLGALIGSQLLNSGWSSLDIFRLSAFLRLFVATTFIVVGFQMDEVRVKLRVYGEFFMTAMSLRHSLFTLGRFMPILPRRKKPHPRSETRSEIPDHH